MSLTTQQIEKAKFIGQAIAHDVIRENMSREWTGLDPQDGDQLLAVGLDSTMPEWSEAERIAREAYEVELANGKKV